MSTAVHHLRKTCRVCRNDYLRQFLSLGPSPLANSFLRSETEFAGETFYPLDVYFCENCSLPQLLDVIRPDVLFRDYIYTTGTSDTIAAHNQEYARTLAALLRLSASDLVIEVASNDGSLLRCFQQCGTATLGIEPATNIARTARARGVETLNEFFNSEVALQVRETTGLARAVIANNVLAHVDDPCDFLCGMKALLAQDGLAVLEFPYAGHLIDRLEYDTIYHEHLSYFSVTALTHLFGAAGLSIRRIDHVAVHGGSLRVYAGHREQHGGHAESIETMARQECVQGLTTLARYKEFATEVETNRRELLALLTSLRKRGKRLAAYGAPAKGNTLLNYCNINTELLPYTIDKNPLKVGTYTPGAHIPVLPVSTLLADQPDYVLILAWNFAAEILGQQSEYRNRGGQFIIPIPKPRVI
jgi:hypothetical protein